MYLKGSDAIGVTSRSHLLLSNVFMHQHKAQPSLARFVGFISFMLCILIQRHPRALLSYWVWFPIYHLLLGLDLSECVLRNSPRSVFGSLKERKKLKVGCFRKFTPTSKCGVSLIKKSIFWVLSEAEREQKRIHTFKESTHMHKIYREKNEKKKKANRISCRFWGFFGWGGIEKVPSLPASPSHCWAAYERVNGTLGAACQFPA